MRGRVNTFICEIPIIFHSKVILTFLYLARILDTDNDGIAVEVDTLLLIMCTCFVTDSSR